MVPVTPPSVTVGFYRWGWSEWKEGGQRVVTHCGGSLPGSYVRTQSEGPVSRPVFSPLSPKAPRLSSRGRDYSRSRLIYHNDNNDK